MGRPRKLKVLVVDHDMRRRFSVRHLLQREGHEVHVAVNATAGKELIFCPGGRDLDLLITSMSMPGAGVINMISCAKREIPSIRVIAITRFTPDTVRQIADVDEFLELNGLVGTLLPKIAELFPSDKEE